MSSSRDFSDLRSSGKAPEKSSVAQTCNRLSQFIKEKGSLRDLGLEIAGKLEPKGTPIVSLFHYLFDELFSVTLQSKSTKQCPEFSKDCVPTDKKC